MPHQFPSTRTKHRVLGWAAGLVALAGGLGLALAAVDASWAFPPAKTHLKDLGTELRQQAPQILAELKKHGYHNVGVLKFRVQIDHRAPTFHAGRLNQQVATRTENALILALKDSDTIGVTRSAGFQAAKKSKKATYANPAARQALFQQSYPLAWGKKNVPVDVFLTGLVVINTKTKVGEVRLLSFDQKNAGKAPVVFRTFQFRVGVATLAESGQRFLVPRQVMQNAGSLDDVDKQVQTPGNAGTITGVDNDLKKILDFHMYYDGKEVSLTPDASGYFKCEAPQTGTKEVTYKLKASEKVGLVLFVNGVNTLMMAKANEKPVEQQARWVLEPNQEYTLKGFYPDFKTCYPFKVVPPDGITSAGDMGPEDKWGLIELTLFRAGSPVIDPTPGGDNLTNSNVNAPDPRKLQEILNKVCTKRPSNLLFFDKEGKFDTNIPEVSFTAAAGAGMTIRYWDKE